MQRALLVLFAAGAVGLSGCTPTTHVLPEVAEDPVQTGIHVVDPHLELRIPVVLFPNSPGSWVRNALWDEYRVLVVGTAAGPAVITRIYLIDHFGQPIDPDISIKRLSSASAAALQTFELIGAAYGLAGSMVAIAGLTSSGSWLFSSGAMAGAGAGLAVVGISAYMAASKRRQAHAEVEYSLRDRILELPVSVSEDRVAHGSLFFPITPCARQAVVEYDVEGVPHQLAAVVLGVAEGQLSDEARAAGGCEALTTQPAIGEDTGN